MHLRALLIHTWHHVMQALSEADSPNTHLQPAPEPSLTIHRKMPQSKRHFAARLLVVAHACLHHRAICVACAMLFMMASQLYARTRGLSASLARLCMMASRLQSATSMSRVFCIFFTGSLCRGGTHSGHLL